MKKVFIGIDFSKLKFDAVLLADCQTEAFAHNEFSNDANGFDRLIQWISSISHQDKHLWLFCGEHTGLYSLSLTKYLNREDIDIWLENPLQIKRSMGIKRAKNDKVDALSIAQYARRFQDKAVSTRLDQDILEQLKDFVAYRERLVKIKTMLSVPVKEMSRVKSEDPIVFIIHDSHLQISMVDQSIKEVDKQIRTIIKSHNDLYQNLLLLTSIKGVGLQNALMVLILTNNFTKFNNPRKFGCYSGVVPFNHSSGTSIYKKDKISKLANKKMKALLSNAANSAVNHNPKLKDYYIRKLQDGKDRALIINNVRNKLIHIMFAVVKNRKPYDLNYADINNNVA